VSDRSAEQIASTFSSQAIPAVYVHNDDGREAAHSTALVKSATISLERRTLGCCQWITDKPQVFSSQNSYKEGMPSEKPFFPPERQEYFFDI
jgi:hypothetical protein